MTLCETEMEILCTSGMFLFKIFRTLVTIYKSLLTELINGMWRQFTLRLFTFTWIIYLLVSLCSTQMQIDGQNVFLSITNLPRGKINHLTKIHRPNIWVSLPAIWRLCSVKWYKVIFRWIFIGCFFRGLSKELQINSCIKMLIHWKKIWGYDQGFHCLQIQMTSGKGLFLESLCIFSQALHHEGKFITQIWRIYFVTKQGHQKL